MKKQPCIGLLLAWLHSVITSAKAEGAANSHSLTDHNEFQQSVANIAEAEAGVVDHHRVNFEQLVALHALGASWFSFLYCLPYVQGAMARPKSTAIDAVWFDL